MHAEKRQVGKRCAGLSVGDAALAHKQAVAGGGKSVLAPTTLKDEVTGKTTVVSEVAAYGDVVLRFLSGDYDGPFLPNYATVDGPSISYGVQRLDHAVGNVPCLFDATDYLMAVTGANLRVMQHGMKRRPTGEIQH